MPFPVHPPTGTIHHIRLGKADVPGFALFDGRDWRIFTLSARIGPSAIEPLGYVDCGEIGKLQPETL
jgi:hypothetical protein